MAGPSDPAYYTSLYPGSYETTAVSQTVQTENVEQRSMSVCTPAYTHT